MSLEICKLKVDKMETVYVLHEYGANSHYNGLLTLCIENNITLKFREFRIFHLIGSGIKHKNIKSVFKQVVNFFFLVNLVFSRNKIVVLGMHPYDKRLPILSFLLKRHTVFYHTSFTMWNPNDTEKYRNVTVSQRKRLENFLMNQVRHVFAVTKKAKESIIANTCYPQEKISVVYHSYLVKLEASSKIPSLNSYIYVGRMDWDKGIKEICEYFAIHTDRNISMIGDGENLAYVKNMALKYANIHYEGYIKGILKLKPHYQKSAYFILNSKKTQEWEELFGQVLIESMSCGCVPIAVNHSGPKEIICNNVNGFIFQEGKLPLMLDQIHLMDDKSYMKIRNAACHRGAEFKSSNIAKYWKPILEIWNN